jgi:hopanoid biosynthesis associated radical SAM protein HpnH
MLEPTELCNFACEGCGRIREYKGKKEQLSLSECVHAVEECQAPVISVCGGEPLLYPDIVPLMEELQRQEKCVYLCTNGYFLEQKVSLLPQWPLCFINVHMDGLENTHDMVVQKKGAFQQAVEGIKAARKAGFQVCTNTTVYQQTEVEEIKSLFQLLTNLGVGGLLVSPSYPYPMVECKTIFMDNEEIYKKFRALQEVEKKYPFVNTPPYFRYLRGERDLVCSPWGCPTRNPNGWKGPCYLITDSHYATYQELMEKTDWPRFENKEDPRCKHCMVHSGFEPTVSVGTGIGLIERLQMMSWSFF